MVLMPGCLCCGCGRPFEMPLPDWIEVDVATTGNTGSLKSRNYSEWSNTLDTFGPVGVWATQTIDYESKVSIGGAATYRMNGGGDFNYNLYSLNTGALGNCTAFAGRDGAGSGTAIYWDLVVPVARIETTATSTQTTPVPTTLIDPIQVNTTRLDHWRIGFRLVCRVANDNEKFLSVACNHISYGYVTRIDESAGCQCPASEKMFFITSNGLRASTGMSGYRGEQIVRIVTGQQQKDYATLLTGQCPADVLVAKASNAFFPFRVVSRLNGMSHAYSQSGNWREGWDFTPFTSVTSVVSSNFPAYSPTSKQVQICGPLRSPSNYAFFGAEYETVVSDVRVGYADGSVVSLQSGACSSLTYRCSADAPPGVSYPWIVDE